MDFSNWSEHTGHQHLGDVQILMQEGWVRPRILQVKSQPRPGWCCCTQGYSRSGEALGSVLDRGTEHSLVHPLWWGLHCRVLSGIPGLDPLDATSI